MISARKAKIKSLESKARIEKVDYKQVKKLVLEIDKAVKKAAKQGLFEASVTGIEISHATLMSLKSILLSKGFFYILKQKVLTVYWE